MGHDEKDPNVVHQRGTPTCLRQVRNIVQGQYTQAIGRKFMEHLPLLPAANSHDLWWEQKAHRNYVKTRRSSNSQTVVVNLQYW